MKRSRKLQYTLRCVPSAVDQALRQRARAESKSLNQAALEALQRGAGVSTEGRVYTDLDDLIGTWQEDPEFDKSIAAQHVIDRRLWR